MDSPKTAELTRRGVVAVGGPEATTFLNDLVTSDVPVAEGTARYGALLTPQGKMLFDFIVFRDGDRYLFDLPADQAAAFAKRLTFYKLRAKVDVTSLPDLRVVAGWNGAVPTAGVSAPDPRLADLGWRAIVTGPVAANATEADYDAHRIALAIPEGGIDFPFGDTFPHDAAMDQLGGVDFKKGCYVGQEVVSRMQHRGTARRRFVVVDTPQTIPAPGSAITAAGRPLGVTATSSAGSGLALLRLDRTKDALDSGAEILAADVPVTVKLPPWARYEWPNSATSDEA